MASGTKILQCVCESDFQDSQYGKNKRVFNGMKSGQYRCSVCLRVGGEAQAIKAKGKK